MAWTLAWALDIEKRAAISRHRLSVSRNAGERRQTLAARRRSRSPPPPPDRCSSSPASSTKMASHVIGFGWRCLALPSAVDEATAPTTSTTSEARKHRRQKGDVALWLESQPSSSSSRDMHTSRSVLAGPDSTTASERSETFLPCSPGPIHRSSFPSASTVQAPRRVEKQSWFPAQLF